MKKFDSLEKYYALRAPEYEQIYYRDFPAKLKELEDESARLVKLVEGMSVLDLACGTGYWTHVISRTAESIVASDLSGEMIAEARKKSFNQPVDFVRADLYHLPFATRGFDAVTLGFWFSHEPKQNYEAFFEMIRPLARPDGVYWMIDNNPPAEGPRLQSVGQDEHGNNYKQRFLDNGEEFAILKNYFEEEELEQIFSRFFAIENLIYNECYWSVVLRNPHKPS